MKKINKFCEDVFNGPPLTIFAFLFTILFVLSNIMLYFVMTDAATKGMKVLTINERILLTLLVSSLFALIGTGLMNLVKKSKKFWDKAKLIEAEIKKATSKNELQMIYQNDFKALEKLAFGKAHYTELIRLKAIMDTLYDYFEK